MQTATNRLTEWYQDCQREERRLRRSRRRLCWGLFYVATGVCLTLALWPTTGGWIAWTAGCVFSSLLLSTQD